MKTTLIPARLLSNGGPTKAGQLAGPLALC
jgi:hypothetical protein